MTELYDELFLISQDCTKERSALRNSYPRRINWEGDEGAQSSDHFLPLQVSRQEGLRRAPARAVPGPALSWEPLFWAKFLTHAAALRQQNIEHQKPTFLIYQGSVSNFSYKNSFHKALLES